MRHQPLDNAEIIRRMNDLVKGEKRYRDCKLSTTVVAKELGISRSTLSTIINKEMHTTFVDYVNGLRLKQARHMMKCNSKGHTLEHISLLSGFACPSTFYRQYKKVYGETPRKTGV